MSDHQTAFIIIKEKEIDSPGITGFFPALKYAGEKFQKAAKAHLTRPSLYFHQQISHRETIWISVITRLGKE